jgi:hypothetical protein
MPRYKINNTISDDIDGKCTVPGCDRCHCEECEFEWESLRDE